MAHKTVTHPDSEAMRKIPHTVLRSGVYHFNRRYPRSLVDAGLVPAGTKRVSLKTSDLAEARTKAAIETIKFQNEVEELSARLQGSDLHGVQTAATNRSLRPLYALSKEEQKNLVIEWFVEAERIAERDRWETWESNDEERKELFRCTTLEDARESERPENTDWKLVITNFLQQKGISYEAGRDGDEMIGLLKRADRETYRRTLKFLETGRAEEQDSFFHGVHASTDLRSETLPQSGRTVGEICAKYPTRKQSGRLAPATISRNEPQIRAFLEFFGPDRSLASLQHEDGEEFVRFLRTIPTNVKKRKQFDGLSLPEAARIEASLPANKRKTLAPKTQKDTLNTALAILNYAQQIGWIDRIPFSGKPLGDLLPEPDEKEVRSFTSDELTKMLSSEMFLNERKKEKQARYWVTLIGLLHGVRQNEAASLLIEDIKEEDGVRFFNLRTTDDLGKVVKRLKTTSSKRRVPLHKELIRMGFLDYVEMRKARTELTPEGKGFLFDELKPNPKTENRAKVLSQWFGRLRDKAIPDEREREGKSFHSFRHEVTDRVRALTESDEKRYALLGWTSDNEKKNAGYGYGSGFSIASLKELVDQIAFPGFDFSLLYPENLDR